LLVAGGPPVPGRSLPQDRQAWLRQACQQAQRFGAICNGAFLLGHAGLLAGRTVTTHWNDAAALAQLCPHAKVEADRIYVEDGNLYSSAGVTAGIDLALWLAGQVAGEEHAKVIQLFIEYDPQPPFDSGHVSKASPETKATATELMTKELEATT
jgi:transcriptional regulator GlxA family with amidase domain